MTNNRRPTWEFLDLGVLLHVELDQVGPELQFIREVLKGGVHDIDLLQVLEVREGNRELLKVLVFLDVKLLKSHQQSGCRFR